MVWCMSEPVCLVVPLCSLNQGGLSVGTNPFGVQDILSYCLMILRFEGGSHGGEALVLLGTMVPQDDSPKGGAAHGPRHPSCF